MGHIRHHAILVTSFDERGIKDAHQEAERIFAAMEDISPVSAKLEISPIIESPLNEYKTFFIPPDGSKEGWDTSDQGDRCRKEFVDWLNSRRFDDGSSYLDWAVVRYGDDDGNNALESSDGDR